MKTAALLLGFVLVLIALDACRPMKRALRRPRESHRVSAVAPRPTRLHRERPRSVPVATLTRGR